MVVGFEDWCACFDIFHLRIPRPQDQIGARTLFITTAQFHGQRHHHQGERHHYGNGFYQDAKSRLPSVKLPCFNGSSDPNVYLDWEAKCEQIFEIHEIQDEHKLKLATLEFSDYAMKWWHGIVKNIIYHKGPPVDSWNSLKDHMRVRFLPPHFMKDLMLRLQRFNKAR